MAAQRLTIDLLLMTYDSDHPYIQIGVNFRTDGSEAKIISGLDDARRNLKAGTKEQIYGVSYHKTSAGDMAALWIEATTDKSVLADAQAWLEQLGVEWVKVNTDWEKIKTPKPRKGYSGYSLREKATA